MFRQSAVLIIGAGASVDYDMPLGSKLVSEIASEVPFTFDRNRGLDPVTGSPELFRILYRKFKQHRVTLDKFTVAGNALASVLSSAVSVDDALYQLSETPEAVTLGKMCIVRTILQAEGKSPIRPDRNARPNDMAGHDGWIEQIFSIAISGLKQSEMEQAFDKVTFVNFNYDRCIEYYLFWAFQRIGLNETRAANIVRGIKMIRPYGGIGSILPGASDFVAFGGPADLFRAIPRIRTFTESDAIHDGNALESAINSAHLIMFLGFGFHAQNMQLLKATLGGRRRVMATVKKMHQGNRGAITDVIVSELLCHVPSDVELFDMTAPEMLRDLRPRIQIAVS